MNELEEAGLRLKLAAAERERESWFNEYKTLREYANELEKCRDTLAAKVRDLEWDIDAYRGALGYSVPADHTGKLRDGATPQCGICNSEWHKNLEAKCAEMRVALEMCTETYLGMGHLAHVSDMATLLNKRTEAINHALSSDCGRDYVPRAELEKQMSDLRASLYADFECLRVKNQVLETALKECVEALEFASNAYDDETSVVELAARLYDVSCTAKLTLTKAKELLK